MTSEDQTDRIQQLEKRIEELENKQQLSKLSRRGLLAGVAGVAGLGAMSGSGAAASGQVGTANNRVNVFADQVDASKLTLGPNNEYRTAFTDSELTDALNAASQGDHIRLGSEEFTQNRTITTDFITISGTGPMFLGTDIEADWTLDGEVMVQNLSLGGTAQITINETRSRISGLTMGGSTSITVNADKALIANIIGTAGTITFASGTSNGIIDTCTAVNITDNGSNTIGDIG